MPRSIVNEKGIAAQWKHAPRGAIAWYCDLSDDGKIYEYWVLAYWNGIHWNFIHERIDEVLCDNIPELYKPQYLFEVKGWGYDVRSES